MTTTANGPGAPRLGSAGEPGRVLRRAARHTLDASESALPLMRRILEQQAAERTTALGARHADTLSAENALAVAYLADDRGPVAIDHLRRLAEVCAATLGADHPDTLVVRGNLAVARLGAGHTAQARTELVAVVDDRTRVLGADHASTLNGRLALGFAHLCAGSTEAATDLLTSTHDAVVARHGRRHQVAVSCRRLLAAID